MLSRLRTSSFKTHVAAITATLGVVSGCSRNDLPAGPVGRTTPNLALARGEAQPPQLFDDRLVALARRAPGFGGYYIDADGQLVVYVTAAGNESAVRTAVREFILRNSANRESELVSRALPALRIRRGAYGFDELAGWKATLESRVPPAGLVLSDVEERSNSIVLGVTDQAAANRIDVVLASLKNVPRSAVQVRVVGPIRREQQTDIRLVTTPRIGGVQISTNQSLCTLGANVQPASYSSGSEVIDSTYRYFVTASHCTDVEAGPDPTSTQFGQPSISNGVIGQEAYDPAIAYCGVTNDTIPTYCRYSDAAIIRYSAGVARDFGRLANVGSLGGFSIVGNYLITAEDVDLRAEGATVYKIGKTTGLTTGTIQRTCVRVYIQTTPNIRFYSCLNTANYGSSTGDSGGPVYSLLGNGRVSFEGVHGGVVGTSATEKYYSPVYNMYLDFASTFGTPVFRAVGIR